MSEYAKLLRTLPLFSELSDQELAALSSVLKERALKDGEIIFEEGALGESLFFAAKGAVAISKGAADGPRKELAVLNPGDCFGEMAILEPSTRSARAAARGQTLVLELSRKDIERWTKENGVLAASFFAGLLQVQSQRLRRTSAELTLLYDLSSVLLNPWDSAKELMPAVLERILPHLRPAWSAAACLRNEFNGEIETFASSGSYDFSASIAAAAEEDIDQARWMGESVFCASLPDPQGGKSLGFLIFHCGDKLLEDERSERGRVLRAAAHLVASAVVNVRFRVENNMRARLRERSHGSIV